MKRLILLFLFLSMSLGAARSAHAVDITGTGNDFLACENAKGETLLQCYSYIRGMHEATLFWVDALSVPSPYCMPSTANYMQGIDVVVRFLKERPAERHKHMVGVYVAAFINAFPCPPTQPLPPAQKRF